MVLKSLLHFPVREDSFCNQNHPADEEVFPAIQSQIIKSRPSYETRILVYDMKPPTKFS
jgi:hypothetical protein